MKKIFTSAGLWTHGIVIVRCFTGLIMFKYGMEIFDKEAMNGYTSWLSDVHIPAPRFMAYLGKLAELAGGISLVLGLMTRWLMIPLAIVMIVITFIMFEGKIFSDNQHPFLLLLISLFFCFSGPGKWSLDYLLFDVKKNQQPLKF
jgi:putative oxidoreductase